MAALTMNCLFCRSNGPFATSEHIIPESLGNTDLVISGHVCDACQNYFGREIENFVLSKTPFGLWRVLLRIPRKDGKLPTIDLSIPKLQRILPIWSEHHDNRIGLTAHEDGSVSLDIDDPAIVKELLSRERDYIQFVFSPKHLEQIGRLLGKICLELLCLYDPYLARSAQFDKLRNYVRRGVTKEIWPIFYANKGNLKDLIRQRAQPSDVDGETQLYEYTVQWVEPYWIFSLHLGVDLWVLYMNDSRPSPIVKEVYPGLDWKPLWYPRDSWTNLFPQKNKSRSQEQE